MHGIPWIRSSRDGTIVLGEVAYLHALTAHAAPLHAFEPQPRGHRLPSHVYQLA